MSRKLGFLAGMATMFGLSDVNVMKLANFPIEQRPKEFEPEEQPKPGQQIFHINGKRIVALNYKNAVRKAAKL